MKPWKAKVLKKVWVFLTYDASGLWVTSHGGPSESVWLVPGTEKP